MNLAGLPPQTKAEKVPRDPAYLRAVKEMACAACGKPGPSDAHHCRDQPPFNERHIYRQLPGAGRKSSDYDCVPLCKTCHQTGPEAYHRNRGAFHAIYGPDYSMIQATRDAVERNTTIEF